MTQFFCIIFTWHSNKKNTNKNIWNNHKRAKHTNNMKPFNELAHHFGHLIPRALRVPGNSFQIKFYQLLCLLCTPGYFSLYYGTFSLYNLCITEHTGSMIRYPFCCEKVTILNYIPLCRALKAHGSFPFHISSNLKNFKLLSITTCCEFG